MTARTSILLPRTLWGLTLASLLLAGPGFGLESCAGGRSARGLAIRPGLEASLPGKPAQCRELPVGTALQAAIDAAPEGSALCLAPGTYPGSIRLDRKVTVWGPRAAILKSRGQGTTVRITGHGAALLGVTIDGSGGRYDLQDAAVLVQSDDVRVEGVRVEHAIFGILLEKSNRCVLLRNEVIGTDEGTLGLRGDGIRLWETRDSRVEGNFMTHSRDLVVWYSSRNHLIDNTVQNSRYGTHLMYSHQNVLTGNRYLHDVVGVFLMYSRDVTLDRNLIAGSAGAAGVGIGAKESGNLTITRNLLLNNTIGAHLDTTPLQVGDFNRFESNVFRLSDVGIYFLSSQHHNLFLNNSFRDNRTQVEVDGGGDALGVTWQRNDFDDYAGYDLNGDGLGDIPYQLRSLSGELTSRYPNLGFFRGMAALSLVDAVSHIVPLFQPRTILVDESPRMAALPIEDLHAN